AQAHAALSIRRLGRMRCTSARTCASISGSLGSIPSGTDLISGGSLSASGRRPSASVASVRGSSPARRRTFSASPTASSLTVARAAGVDPHECPTDVIERAMREADLIVDDLDDGCALRPTLAHVAALEVAGEDHVRTLVQDGALVDVAKRPVVVTACDEVVKL